jgi:hypothetical protein
VAKAWGINASGGVPEYNAQELRRLNAIHLHPASADRFGARSGVRPHSGDAVTVSGTTWTQHDLTAVVYPGLTAISGPYVVEKLEESGSLDPADGSNPRIDALDLQVRDDDEDASGARDVRVAYVPGTPASSPLAPPLTDSSLRLATIFVPAGGSPSPSVQTLAPWVVAAGGVLPARGASELPDAGQYEGMVAYRQDTDELQVWNGSGWVGLASPTNNAYVTAMTDAGQAFGWNVYQPTVSGGGSATFSVRDGRWKRLAPLTVHFIVDILVSTAGSGTSNVQVTAPTGINRATRQTALVAVEGAAGGGGGNRAGYAVSFTGGSGSTWDRIRIPDGVDSHLDNLTGAMLASGMQITIQGTYQEEE